MATELKVLFNQDGSIKATQFPTYVMQGNNLVDKLQVAFVDSDITTSGYVVVGKFQLPNGSTTNLTFNEDVTSTILGADYPAKQLKLPRLVTLYAGILLVSIEINNPVTQETLFTFQSQITINPTGYTMDEMFNGTQYDQLASNVAYLMEHAITVGDITSVVYNKTEVNELLSAKEDVANKVTTLSSESTDVQYPSAKAVWDTFARFRGPIPYYSVESNDSVLDFLAENDVDKKTIGLYIPSVGVTLIGHFYKVYQDNYMFKFEISGSTTRYQNNYLDFTGKTFADIFNSSNQDDYATCNIVASKYDESESYTINDLIIRGPRLLVCTASTTGTWDSSKWSDATLDEVINARISAAQLGGTASFDSVPTSGSQNAVKSNGIYDALQTKENLSNKVTVISDHSTNVEYPSAAAVYEKIGEGVAEYSSGDLNVSFKIGGQTTSLIGLDSNSYKRIKVIGGIMWFIAEAVVFNKTTDPVNDVQVEFYGTVPSAYRNKIFRLDGTNLTTNPTDANRLYHTCICTHTMAVGDNEFKRVYLSGGNNGQVNLSVTVNFGSSSAASDTFVDGSSYYRILSVRIPLSLL